MNQIPFHAPGDTESLTADFQREGFAVVRSLFPPESVAELRQAFDDLHAAGAVPGYFEPVPRDQSGGDPLKVFPRVMHPHRFKDVARRYMLHPAIGTILQALFGEEPIAAQSMFYFKPPGARGQALHQDQFYLMVEPGTCIAAWVAVDDSDAENGGLYVVPNTRDAEVVCPDKADEAESFTSHFVRPPAGQKAVVCELKAGDVLFFNGNLIHGSGPNRSKNRFRRSFICHYVAGSTDRISRFYNPLVRMDGSEIEIAANESGGPCGELWKGATH
jgi:phytanoyl-CoA hydroxylase